uniref:Sugar transporter SWEET n=1 Tax=Clastoptera arizonana TaxID=38151 RepID=A0A1B6BYL0_9HEMI
MGLEDYKDIVATAAGITTIAQCFAPAFICKNIVKKGSTKGFDALPFIGGIVISILMLQHGMILNDPTMIPVNIFGFGLNLCYLLCYYFYCEEKGPFFTTLAKAVGFIAIMVGYAKYEKPDLVEFRFGFIVTIIMLALIGFPLLSLGEIIKTKNTESLPFPLISSGAVVTSLWLLYGFIIDNVFVQVQNAVGLTLCLIQLSLIFIFQNKSENKQKDKAEELKPKMS